MKSESIKISEFLGTSIKEKEIEMSYKCIIFDCDGVLVDSEEISNRVLVDMAKTVGVEIDMVYANTYFQGTSLKSIFKLIEEQANKSLPSNFEDEFRKKTFELFKTDIKPIKGIHKVLKRLSVPICVASSGPSEKIKLNLKTTRLLENFGNNIYSCYDIGSWKPNPEIFEHAAREMGFKPEDCLVVEDSIAGIRAAKTGGFVVYGYASDKNRKAFEDEGAIVFSEMDDLVALIEEGKPDVNDD